MMHLRVLGARTLPLCAALALNACTPESSISRNRATDTFNQEPESIVDILWVVDNSASMIEEQQRLADAFESFVGSLSESNIDFHIGVVTSDMDLDNRSRGLLLGTPRVITRDDDYVGLFQDRVQVGVDGSDKEKGIAAAIEAVSEPLASGANAGFSRPEATLLVVFLSDENDCSDDGALEGQPGTACYEHANELVPVDELVGRLRAAKSGSRVLASSIVGPPIDQACPDSWPGSRYRRVAEATGGLVGDICDSDYSDMMGRMGLSVSGVLNAFQLSNGPDPDSIEVYVDDVLIEEDPVSGWSYDPAWWMIRFDGNFVPPRGSTISVSYFVSATGSPPGDAAAE